MLSQAFLRIESCFFLAKLCENFPAPVAASSTEETLSHLRQGKKKAYQPSWSLAAEVEIAGISLGQVTVPAYGGTVQPTLCCPGLPTRPAPQEGNTTLWRKGLKESWMNSRAQEDTGAWTIRASHPHSHHTHLHSLRWRPLGPSSLSGAVLACSAGPLSSSAAPPLWTVTAWHLLPPGSYRICTGQHLNKEYQELAHPEGSDCQGLLLSALPQSCSWLVLRRKGGYEQGLYVPQFL